MDQKSLKNAYTPTPPISVTHPKKYIGCKVKGSPLSWHNFYLGAPDKWSEERGATHTLWLGTRIGAGSRPAKLLKTIAYIGIDEDENGDIVWEKWGIKQFEPITDLQSIHSIYQWN